MSGPKQLESLDGVDLSQLVGIPGFPGYFINSKGEVFCIRRLNTYKDKNGYIRSWMYVNRKKKRPGIHTLLALAFKKERRSGQNEVRHLDGNVSNHSLDNLAWGTRKENAEDMAIHGSVKGEKNPRAMLTEKQVIAIRWASVVDPLYLIARRFGVSTATIHAIVTRRNWSHVVGCGDYDALAPR